MDTRTVGGNASGVRVCVFVIVISSLRIQKWGTVGKKSKPYVPIVCAGHELDLNVAADRLQLAELKTGAMRLRNFGAAMSTIADKLGLSETDAEFILTRALQEVMQDDAEQVRARQQATLNDIRRASYPGMEQGDTGSAGILLKVLDHEANLHGLKAPTRVRVGLDQEAFTSTVDEDMRALGIHPRMDVELNDVVDEGWASND
jgi:hypothetical protein